MENHQRRPARKYWGIFDANGMLKPGMERIFSGETLPDNWTSPSSGPPIMDFFALPDTINTNIANYLVAGETDPANVVKVNGSPIASDSMDTFGAFSLTVPLNIGTNTLVVSIESAAGQVLTAVSKTV